MKNTAEDGPKQPERLSDELESIVRGKGKVNTLTQQEDFISVHTYAFKA